MQNPELSRFLSRVPSVFTFRTFHILLLGLTGCAVILLCIQSMHYLPVTSENIYPESSGVLSALRWANGSPLYTDFRKAPYLSTPFPPLWYALTAQEAKMGFGDLDSLMLLGRILALGCLLGIAALAYSWNRRLGMSASLALIAPAFFLSTPLLVPWAVVARPDLLALWLSFAALYVAAGKSRLAGVTGASVLASLAFLARHNSVAAPVAIVLWLAWSRKWKHALLFCVAWGTIVGSTLIAFQISSSGLLFLNLSGGKFGQLAFTYVRDVLARLLEPQGQGFAIAVFAFGSLGLLEALRNRETRSLLLSIYAVVAIGLAVLGSAAAGAAPNHYLEACLALATLIPLGLASLQCSWNDGSATAVMATVLVALILLPSLDAQRAIATHNRPDDLRPLISLLASQRIFSDIPFVAARASTPENVDLASLLNSERSSGRRGWSSAEVVDALSAKRYSLVILSQPIEEAYIPAGLYPRYPRLDAAMKAAIQRSYALCSRSSVAYVYGPIVPGSDSPNCPQPTEQAQQPAATINQ